MVQTSSQGDFVKWDEFRRTPTVDVLPGTANFDDLMMQVPGTVICPYHVYQVQWNVGTK